MDIILFGMQGSGKGTQGKALAARHHLKVFDIGTQFRKDIHQGTLLGKKIKATVEAGDLVDDDEVIQVVDEVLQQTPPAQSLLFDGVPRTLPQAQPMLDLLAQYHREVFAVNIKISEKEAVRRLNHRQICSLCHTIYSEDHPKDVCDHCGARLTVRADDTPEGIRRRIENYHRQTLPVIESFRDRGLLVDIDGEQPIDRVTQEMLEKTQHLFK